MWKDKEVAAGKQQQRIWMENRLGGAFSPGESGAVLSVHHSGLCPGHP